MPPYAVALVRVLATLLVAFVSARTARLLIGRFVRRIDGSATDTAPLYRAKRAQTLGSLLRAVSTVGIWVVGVMVALSQAGVEIGPLVAAAGVGGIAIGLGAQTLVGDVISGFLLLIENQYDVGDVVEAGGVTGTVEEVTLRTTVLRDLDGRRHVVPNGEIRVTSNLTKGFSRYLFTIEVPYDVDIDTVVGELRRLGDELRTDPDLGDAVIAPVKALGVQEYAPDGARLLAHVETLPGEQWRIGRELEARLRRTLAARGLAISYPLGTATRGSGSAA